MAVKLKPGDRIPLFRILREGESKGKFRTLIALPAASGLPVPGDYLPFPGKGSVAVKESEKFDDAAVRLTVKGLRSASGSPLPQMLIPAARTVEPARECLWLPLKRIRPGTLTLTGMRVSLLCSNGYSFRIDSAAKAQLRGRGNITIWQLSFSTRAALLPGQALCVSGKSADEEYEGVVLWSGPSGPQEWSFWENRLARPGVLESAEVRELTALHRGWCALLPGEAGFSSDFYQQEPWLFHKRFHDTAVRKILKRVNRSGGCDEKTLIREIGGNDGWIVPLLDRLEKEGRIVETDGYLLPPEEEREKCLSPVARNLLSQIRESGPEGMSRREVEIQRLSAVLEELIRFEMVTGFGENRVIDTGFFEESLRALCRHWQPGAIVDLAELKEKFSLSRSRLLPLLEVLEERGILRNEGDHRIYVGSDDPGAVT